MTKRSVSTVLYKDRKNKLMRGFTADMFNTEGFF